MRKLDLILENIRDEYMINLLEEGTSSELETLKTKKFLNENLNRIRKMLVEEGALEGVKQHLGDNWGKYLAGAGALGAGALANHYGNDPESHDTFNAAREALAGGETMGDKVYGAGRAIGAGLDAKGGQLMDAASGAYDAAGGAVDSAVDTAGNAVDAAGNAIGAAGNAIGGAYDQADAAVGGALPGGLTADQATSANQIAQLNNAVDNGLSQEQYNNIMAHRRG